jgi:hypothetical protein
MYNIGVIHYATNAESHLRIGLCNLTLKLRSLEIMSQHEYTLVAKTCLIDLPMLPSELLERWLLTKSEWTQIQIRRFVRG